MSFLDGVIAFLALVVAIAAIAVVRQKRSDEARLSTRYFLAGLLIAAATGLVVCGVIVAVTNGR